MDKSDIFVIIFFVLLAIAFVFIIIDKKKGKPRIEIAKTKGQVGEFLAFNNLNTIPGNKGLLRNLYIPKENGETTEIDCLMIHQKGLFVIEAKNYSGHIYGSPNDQKWTQVLRRNVHNSFYNPIKQNEGHIKNLRIFLSNNLQGYNEDMPIYSVITFGPNADLSNVKLYDLQNKKTFVVNTERIAVVVTNVINSIPQDCFSQQRVSEIFNVLFPLINVTDEQKQKHIDDIKNHV